MKSSATYAVFLFTLIPILMSGCSSDNDIPQIQRYQQRSLPFNVALKSDHSDCTSSLHLLDLDEESFITPPATYSF